MATANTKRQSYTTAEKLKVIQFAEQHGNRSAQREFDIAESNIRLCRRSKDREPGENAVSSTCKSWKESGLASSRARCGGLDHGETEQWTGNFADHDQTKSD